jgi:hypothetical protein
LLSGLRFSSVQTALSTKYKSFKMLLPTPLYRMFRPDQARRTHTDSPRLRTRLLPILSARTLWRNIYPSFVENWHGHRDSSESCGLCFRTQLPIQTRFSAFTHTLVQASAPRPALSHGNSGASSDYGNGRRKSLGVDSPEVVTIGESRPHPFDRSYLFVFRSDTTRLGGKACHCQGCSRQARKPQNHHASGWRSPRSSRCHKQSNSTSRGYHHSRGEPLLPPYVLVLI